jgi:tripartite ATP-independent transporter DctM subunit
VTIVALGGVLYPVLRSQQYGEKFTLGLLTTSGSLGMLFPPSLPVILYGVVAQIDIGRIFTAALVPGVLLVAVLSLYAVVHGAIARHRTTPEADVGRPEPVALKPALFASLWDWPIVGIVIVGIYGGYVTIAEVSALVLAYTLIVECLVLREVDFWRQVPAIMVESAILSGAIIIILGLALGFAGYLVDEQIPNRILTLLTGLTENRMLFLIGLNLFLLAVGCIMDIFSAIVIVVPILLPVAQRFGIDPFHLGVIFLVNLGIGYSTPPIGMNLFIASLKFDRPITLLYRASVPYLVLLLALLVLITYVPWLSLCLLK